MEPQRSPRTSNTTVNQNIYFIKVHKHADDPILYFLDAGKSLHDNNKKVQVITNNVSPNQILPVYEDLPITKVGCWLPNSIFGKLSDFLWMFRTIYTVLMCFFSMKSRDSNNVILLDAHYIAIPILSVLTKCKIVTFKYYQEHLNLMRVADITLNKFHCWSLSFSDEVVVPSDLAKRELLYEMDYKYPLTVTTLYPPSEAEHFPIISNAVISAYQHSITMRKHYVAVGPWHSSSDFEVALLAFNDFYDMLDPPLKTTVQLTVLGHMRPDDQEAEAYRKQVSEFSQFLHCKNNISFKTNLDNKVKAVLYRISTAVLNTSIGKAFNCCILEAQFFGTPTISNISGFAAECITSGVNGVLCEGRLLDYAQALYRIKTDTNLFPCSDQDTIDIYNRNYSTFAYGQNLLRVLNTIHGTSNEEIVEWATNNNKENLEPSEEKVVKKVVKRPRKVRETSRPVVHLR